MNDPAAAGSSRPSARAWAIASLAKKIKAVGDAYVAVAGVPNARHDHAEAAAEMALEALNRLKGARWPSGDVMGVGIRLASGPVVAGVIRRRKLA